MAYLSEVTKRIGWDMKHRTMLCIGKKTMAVDMRYEREMINVDAMIDDEWTTASVAVMTRRKMFYVEKLLRVHVCRGSVEYVSRKNETLVQFTKIYTNL